MKGFVYIISNKAMPGLFKIGYTQKHPEIRAKELCNTGVPHPYIVEFEILVDNPHALEHTVHTALKYYKEGKEWFRCDFGLCASTIHKCYSGKIYYERYPKKEREDEYRRQKEKEEAQEIERQLQKQKKHEEEKINSIINEAFENYIKKIQKSEKNILAILSLFISILIGIVIQNASYFLITFLFIYCILWFLSSFSQLDKNQLYSDFINQYIK